jgi:hypothetical protein
MQPSERLLTRQDLIAFIRQKTGIPLSKSYLDKSRMLAGDPQPDGYYGKKELFTEATALEYAQKVLSKSPRKLLESA